MGAPLQIAFDMTFPDRNQAGSAVYARELLDHLRQRDDVVMNTVSKERDGFVNTMRWLVADARHAVRHAQLLHCPAFVAPWRVGVPLILTVHDTSTQRFPEDHTAEWRTYASVVLPRRARAAARVITGTEFTRREIVPDLGLSEDRVVVTPYGVSDRFGLPPHRPFDPNRPILLFPGAPTRRKNLELVLTALAEAPEGTRLKRSKLVITGADPGRFPHHQARIAALGLGDRVDWRGKVPAGQMPEVMASADVLIYPSLYEGFGLPALEAMLACTPVVASNAGCLPEVLGEGALLVDPHDVKAFIAAVEALLVDEARRRSLIEKGRVHVKRFSWSRCAEQTVDAYRAVLAS